MCGKLAASLEQMEPGNSILLSISNALDVLSHVLESYSGYIASEHTWSNAYQHRQRKAQVRTVFDAVVQSVITHMDAKFAVASTSLSDDITHKRHLMSTVTNAIPHGESGLYIHPPGQVTVWHIFNVL